MNQSSARLGAVPRRARAVLAESDPRLCELLQALLEHDGFDVEIVDNGRALLSVLRRECLHSSSNVDLWVMEVRLPEMDGVAALWAVGQHLELPVILLAESFDSRARFVRRTRFVRILQKPFTTGEFVATASSLKNRDDVPADSGIRPRVEYP